MFGLSDVSLLEVFVKPENKSRKDLKSVFSVHENKGDKWVPHVVTIPQMPEPFQVIVSKVYFSDIGCLVSMYLKM